MSTQSNPKPNIYQRLNAVRDAVKYLQKDADVQGYKALTHDAVTAACRKHFIENGIMVVPNRTGSGKTEASTGGSMTEDIEYRHPDCPHLRERLPTPDDERKRKRAEELSDDLGVRVGWSHVEQAWFVCTPKGVKVPSLLDVNAVRAVAELVKRANTMEANNGTSAHRSP